MEEIIVRTIDISKIYGSKKVLESVNMTINKGDIYGFIGKNGAGKTTLMKILLGFTFPQRGSIELFESNDLEKGRRKIGSLIESPGIYTNCSAYENMKRFAILGEGCSDEEINHLLEFVGLGDVGKKKAGSFSLGMKQRLGIAIALLGNPELLILDEPMNGLDPAGIKEFRDLLLKVNHEKNVTILISSHILDELSKIATRYGIINNGKLIQEITPKDLELQCQSYLKITVNDVEAASNLIANEFRDAKMEIHETSIYLYVDLDKSSYINKLLVTNGLEVSELTISKANTEDFFIERLGD